MPAVIAEPLPAATFEGGPLEFIHAHTGPRCRVEAARLLDTSPLPTVSDVVGLLGNPMLRTQAVRVVTDGESQTGRKFSRSTDYNSKAVSDSLDSPSLRRAFASGSTLIVEDVGKWHAPVATMCNAIFNDDWLYANAGYFITRSGNTGLPFHSDEETTFVFQVTGSKKWQVAERPATHLGAAEVTAEDRVYEFVLKPGDAACIPPMCPHRTEAVGDGDSIHLTVGVRPFKLKDFFSDLAVRGMSRVPALDAEVSSIEASLAPLVEAAHGPSGENWRREVAIASIRIASGMADRGFEFIAPGSPSAAAGAHSSLGDLLWRVRLDNRNLVQLWGTFAMMDDAGLDALRTAMTRHAAHGGSWHDMALDTRTAPVVRRFLGAAGWAVDGTGPTRDVEDHA